MEKYTGKVWEFCQSRKVGTMKKKFLLEILDVSLGEYDLFLVDGMLQL